MRQRRADRGRRRNFEKFKTCAVEVLQVPADKVVLDASFADDLDADSLDLVEFVMALEETFDITVDEAELEGVETVGQAYELVTRSSDGVAEVTPTEAAPVVVTGLGVVSCCGIGTRRRSSPALYAPAPSGERRVHDFDPSVWFDPKEARQTDRFAQFSVAAAADGARGRRRARRRPGAGRRHLRDRRRRARDPQEQIGVLDREGPAAGLAAPRPDDDGERRRRGDLDALRLAGPVRDDRHRVRVRRRTRSATPAPPDRDGRCDAVITGGAEAAMTPAAVARSASRLRAT